MRNHQKAIALIFVFLLVGHDCARIQEHHIANAASMRHKRNHKSGSSSQWSMFAREVCPMSYKAGAVQERYHMKVSKLLDAVHTMEDCEWTTTFMWKLREIVLRLDGLGSCVVTASRKPELVQTLTDPNTGLMPVLAKVMHRVIAQLRQREILTWSETSSCKVRLESLSVQQLRKLKVDSEVDVVKATHALLFGADCDVDSYMLSLGLSDASRKDLRNLDNSIIMMANNSLQQHAFQPADGALQTAREVLEKIPSEGQTHDGGGETPSKKLHHDGHDPTPHEELRENEQYLLMQHIPEKSALIEGDAQQLVPDFVAWLDVLAYLGTYIGMFVLIITLVCVVAFGVPTFVKGVTSYVTGGGNGTQDSPEDPQSQQAARIEEMRKKFNQIKTYTEKAAGGGSKRGSKRGRSSSRRNTGSMRRGSSKRILARGRQGSVRRFGSRRLGSHIS